MKKPIARILLISLLAFCLLLTACGAQAEDPVPEVVADTALPVRVMTLNGTTGFGMAGLIAEHSAGGTELNYSFTISADMKLVAVYQSTGTCLLHIIGNSYEVDDSGPAL